MQQTIVITGVVCLIAAIVGGGLKAFGIEIPLLSSRVRQVVLGLFGLILIAAGTIPSMVLKKPSSLKGQAINVRCTASPHAIPAGELAEIRILTFTEQSSPVPDANIKIESGGGWFAGSGTTTEVGVTDAKGAFTTQWRSPKPASAAYVMNVSASKQGLIEGKEECRVHIQ